MFDAVIEIVPARVVLHFVLFFGEVRLLADDLKREPTDDIIGYLFGSERVLNFFTVDSESILFEVFGATYGESSGV